MVCSQNSIQHPHIAKSPIINTNIIITIGMPSHVCFAEGCSWEFSQVAFYRTHIKAHDPDSKSYQNSVWQLGRLVLVSSNNIYHFRIFVVWPLLTILSFFLFILKNSINGGWSWWAKAFVSGPGNPLPLTQRSWLPRRFHVTGPDTIRREERANDVSMARALIRSGTFVQPKL